LKKIGIAMYIAALHHVQLAMPKGGEDAARAFYGGLLGLSEAPKPPILAARGGVWFERGEVRVHLGVEQDFRPARKAHPAFQVQGVSDLLAHLAAKGAAVTYDDTLPGFVRGYVNDPFGNRIELLEPAPAG
jgi:catechol 2,3-dioxygenase-like lactoylglutathione lyase family enzyme